MKRLWIRGLTLGADIAALVAAVMTYRDWRFNPGGVFRGDEGTHWRVVGETAFSWFWPTWLTASAVALVVLWWIARRR